MNLSMIFLLFFIYSIIGWIIEVIAIIIEHKRAVNRGFLIGPYCPIYGWGGIAIVLLLKNSADDLLALFLKSIVICAFLEYITGYVLEKIFHAKWWDYSNKKFNINGYICLENMFLFGIGACIIVHFINPFFIRVLGLIPNTITIIIAIILAVIFISDNVISIRVVVSLKNDYKKNKDFAIAGMNKNVKEVLREYSVIYRRFMEAFPPIREKFIATINKYTKSN